MPDVHALLSASSSKQWLHCPPSIRLQEGFPNESSVYAAEGTFAHEICEYKVRKYLHERVKRPQSEEYDTEEIEQITDVYAEFVISIIEKMKENGCEPLAFVEERVNYSHIAPSGFGTADMLIIGKDENGKGLLHVCDFKTGKGIFVDADHNSQMMLYALGGLAAYGFLYDIEIVRMSIIQPRLDNISTFECSVQELEEWGESIKPIAKLAYEGKGEQNSGDWCRFCRAKPVCKACADEALALCREDFLDLDAGVFDTTEESDMTAPYEADTNTAVFKQPGLIPLSELAEILPTLNRISSWIEAVFAFVSSEAINHGVPIPKDDKATLAKIKKAIEAAKEAAKSKKWGGKLPPNLKMPMHDGDVDRPDDENYAGHYFFNATSKDAPQIVDRHVQPILDPMECGSGDYCNVSVNFYGFAASGNKGIAAGLQNIQLVRHGERLAGRPTAASDFEAIEGEDEELGEVDEDMDFLN